MVHYGAKPSDRVIRLGGVNENPFPRNSFHHSSQWLYLAGPATGLDATPATAHATPTPLLPPPNLGSAERWIEVDLAAQIVRLREGDRIVAEHPASSGVALSPETTTHPGIYQVQQKIEGPIENVPGVFVSNILIFDLAAGVGIHSLPMDKDGGVLDNTLGKPVTAGCVRVVNSDTVFRFARLGTTIWVH